MFVMPTAPTSTKGPDPDPVPTPIAALPRTLTAPGIGVPPVRAGPTRSSYLKSTSLDERTATRDLVKAAEIGLLDARGERRGRHYVAGEPLRKIRHNIRSQRKPLDDPFPS